MESSSVEMAVADAQRGHGVEILHREAHQLPQGQRQVPVGGQPLLVPFELVLVGQVPVEQQVADLLERRVRAEVEDVVALVDQPALGAVDVADAALAGEGALQPRAHLALDGPLQVPAGHLRLGLAASLLPGLLGGPQDDAGDLFGFSVHGLPPAGMGLSRVPDFPAFWRLELVAYRPGARSP